MTTNQAFHDFHGALVQLDDALRQHLARAAGSKLATSLDDEGAEALALDSRVLVANAGMVNAGKSSLFNALLDAEQHFAVKDARCTRTNGEAPLGDMVLVDTPGLDADGQDAREAEATFRRADRIVFVHGAEHGEMDQFEIAFLRGIAAHFPPEDLVDRLVPVLSKAEADDHELDAIEAVFRAQWQAICGFVPLKVHRVATPTYFKGVAEHKPGLVAFSQVPALREALREAVPALREAKGRLFKERTGQWIARQVAALEADVAALRLTQAQRERQARQDQQRLEAGLTELVRVVGARREACRQQS
jgi:tRNA U34 5-carboxymethylaminomethyl modifying GTPase MnmE/TrmE